MIKGNEQMKAAALITAFTHLLVGRSGCHAELNDKVSIIYGPPANLPTLLHWGDWVRRNGPIVHVSHDEERRGVLNVALVCVTKGQTRIFEQCELWLRRDGVGAHIVPSTFEWGSYVIGDDLSLKHLKRTPMPAGKAFGAGWIRAHERLWAIFAAQKETDIELGAPVKLRKAA